MHSGRLGCFLQNSRDANHRPPIWPEDLPPRMSLNAQVAGQLTQTHPNLMPARCQGQTAVNDDRCVFRSDPSQNSESQRSHVDFYVLLASHQRSSAVPLQYSTEHDTPWQVWLRSPFRVTTPGMFQRGCIIFHRLGKAVRERSLCAQRFCWNHLQITSSWLMC